MFCQVVLLFHFFSSCFFFYFSDSKLEHSTLEGSRRRVSAGWKQGRRVGGVIRAVGILVERQPGEFPSMPPFPSKGYDGDPVRSGVGSPYIVQRGLF